MKYFFGLLLLLSFSYAFGAVNCYPLEENEGSFSKICVEVLAEALDSPATITVFKGEKKFVTIVGKRKYYPRRTICPGKEHDCREVPSSLQVEAATKIKNNEINVNIRLWQAAIEKCYSGSFQVRELGVSYVESWLQCPAHWWDQM